MKKQLPFVFWCSVSFLLGAGLTLLANHYGVLPRRGPVAASPGNGVSVRTGPWGTLEELEIPLGDSSDLFIDRPARLAQASWFFENYSKAQLETLLRACNLTPAQWQLLQNSNAVTIAPNGIVITPPAELVWTLSPATRARLYEALSKVEVNYTQSSPFRFTFDRFEERLATAGLSPAKQARISSLTYTNRGFLCFSDLQLLSGLLTTNELDRVSEALYRVPAYRLRLRVMPDSDINAVVRYWGQNGREKYVRPLLESLTKVHGPTNGVTINISMFLPPTARVRLFTYPDAWPTPEAERQDCFWTSLNFFRDPPDSKFLDSEHNKETLATDYNLIHAKPTFGDLVVLADENGNGLHACVYIADDIVFTKNGVNRLQPWVLMKMSDMLAHFPSEKSSRIAIFRRKEPPANSQDSAPQERLKLASDKGKPAPSAR